jgi:hypothetical protein
MQILFHCQLEIRDEMQAYDSICRRQSEREKSSHPVWGFWVFLLKHASFPADVCVKNSTQGLTQGQAR